MRPLLLATTLLAGSLSSGPLTTQTAPLAPASERKPGDTLYVSHENRV